MRYFGLSVEEANKWHESKQDGGEIPELQVQEFGEGGLFDLASVKNALAKMNRIKSALNVAEVPDKSPVAARFERVASIALHRSLRIDLEIASDPNFWRWLSIVAEEGGFAELITWRFAGKNPAEKNNYGIGSVANMKEGLFARLWYRAELTYDENEPDPYTYTRRGSVDFWRSHIFRQDYARSFDLRIAFIRSVYPTTRGAASVKISQVREMAKKLRISDARFSFDSLGAARIDDKIKGIRIEAGD